MAKRYALRLDMGRLEALAPQLANATEQDMSEAVVSALNQTVEETYELSRERITSGINLTDDYVRRRMRVEHATKARPEASIIASGKKPDMTTLRRYDAQQVTVPMKRPELSRNQGRTGVPRGRKQRAVTVQVTRGSPVSLPYAFMLPLRRGTVAGGNGLGVFLRDRDGDLSHRYGPSVYQLFNYQAQVLLEGTADDLVDDLLNRAEQALLKAID